MVAERLFNWTVTAAVVFFAVNVGYYYSEYLSICSGKEFCWLGASQKKLYQLHPIGSPYKDLSKTLSKVGARDGSEMYRMLDLGIDNNDAMWSAAVPGRVWFKIYVKVDRKENILSINVSEIRQASILGLITLP